MGARKASDRVDGDVKPREVGNGERSKKTLRRVVSSLVPGTGVAGNHKALDVLLHGGPPEVLS